MRRLCLVLSTAVVLSLAPMGAQTASAAPAEREMRAATATGTASQLLRTVPAVPPLRVGYKQGLFPNLASKARDRRGCTLRNQMLITLAVKKPKVGAGCKLTGGTWVADFGRTVVTNPNQVRLAKLVPDVYVYGQGASGWTQAQRDAFTRVVPPVTVSSGKQTRLRPAVNSRLSAILGSFIVPTTPKSQKFFIAANALLATNAEPTQAQLDALKASNPAVFKDWSLATLLNAKAWGLSLSPQLYSNFQVSLTQCPKSLRARPALRPSPMVDIPNTNVAVPNPCVDSFTVTEAGQAFKINVIPQIATTLPAADPEVLTQYGEPTGDVITRQLFGIHAPANWFSDLASGTEGPTDEATIPNVPVGFVRLWDTETTWRDIEPSPGKFVWRKLDRQIQTAQVLDAQVMLVLGGTPAWAGDGNPQSPPKSIDDWRRYVREVCKHAGPSVHAYEVWNEANLQTFWSGTPAQMADLTKAAFGEIRACNPGAQVVAANTTSRATGSFGTFFPAYLQELKARGWPADAYSVHSYPSASGGADARIKGIAQFRTALALAGAPFTRIYDTEVNYGLAGLGEGKTDIVGTDAMGLMSRTYIDSARYGFGSTFWFVWTAAPDGKFGIQFTRAATSERQAWNTTYEWLVGSRFQRCLDTSQGITVCQFSKGAENFSIVWYGDRGSAPITTTPGLFSGLGSRMCTLEQQCNALRTDSAVSIGWVPVRIDGAPLSSGPSTPPSTSPQPADGPVSLPTPTIISVDLVYGVSNKVDATGAWVIPTSPGNPLPAGTVSEYEWSVCVKTSCTKVSGGTTASGVLTATSPITEGPGQYRLRVRAVNGSTTSEWGSQGFTVLTTRAAPPSNVSWWIKSGTFQTQWDAPAIRAGLIKGYTVQFQNISKKGPWITLDEAVSGTTLSLPRAQVPIAEGETGIVRVRTVLKSGATSAFVAAPQWTVTGQLPEPTHRYAGNDPNDRFIITMNVFSPWTLPGNGAAYGYQVRQSNDGGTTWRTLNSTSEGNSPVFTFNRELPTDFVVSGNARIQLRTVSRPNSGDDRLPSDWVEWPFM